MGIAAIRIYTAPHQSAYTVNNSSLDTYISLAPGTYQTVVQAWDNCGGVGKTSVTITVTSGAKLPPPRFLYSTDTVGGKVYGYVVNPSTGGLKSTGQNPPWAHWGPTRVVADAGGYRLYVINAGSKDINAYYIDRRNGYIYNVPGSPFPIGQTPNDLRVHPSGKFVYVTVESGGVYGYAVQSNGSLKVVPGSPFPTQSDPRGLSITPNGNYLYVSDYGPGKIDAFSINQTNGAVTPVPGSPFTEQPVGQYGCITGALEISTDASGKFLIVPRACSGGVNVYRIGPSTGRIADVPGSPFALPYPLEVPNSVAVDPLNRFVFLSTEYCHSGCTPDTQIWTFDRQTGAMQFQLATTTYAVCGQLIRTDPSGKYLYGIGDAQQDCNGSQANPAIWGMSYNPSNGNLSNVPGSPFPSPNSNYEYSDGLWVTP